MRLPRHSVFRNDVKYSFLKNFIAFPSPPHPIAPSPPQSFLMGKGEDEGENPGRRHFLALVFFQDRGRLYLTFQTEDILQAGEKQLLGD